MSSRSQRFGARLGGWRSRSIADLPDPTMADLEALVYRQRWEHASGTASEFNVLAFDAAHAEGVGAMKLAEDLVNLADARMAYNELVEDAGIELRLGVLQSESPSSFDARQREYANRRDNAAERAHERSLENLYGGSSPQTDAERYQDAANWKARQ
jgi:hypothetical protein